MAQVALSHLRKQFGASVAVADFSLEIADGEFVAFLGPSGCGKTTTLRMIAGFIEPSAGRIVIGGQDVTDVPVHRRGTGMVFQRYALFPHMTVAQNISFGLEMQKVQGEARSARIDRALELVRMSELRDRYPRQLSGGQQQRVAIARALAIEPKVFLLDEPLSNLDAKLRLEVRDEIRALQRKLGLTTVFVTHDQEEALSIADRIAIMHDGIVQQVGTPDEVYERPANLFVADFLGKMNFFEGRVAAPGRFVCPNGLVLSMADLTTHSRVTRLGIRPERLRLSREPGQGDHSMAVHVLGSTYLGALLEVQMQAVEPGGPVLIAQLQNLRAGAAPAVGERLHVAFDATDLVPFH
ncbi:MAG: hypothetical protein RL322_1228 [Pseudomonadota bacterium]|jgi:putative spermidine/putrescine transport system ATP-binding protein